MTELQKRKTTAKTKAPCRPEQSLQASDHRNLRDHQPGLFSRYSVPVDNELKNTLTRN